MKSIFAMLRHLPEDAPFTVAMGEKLRLARGDSPTPLSERDPEAEARMDREFWTPDRQLQAQVINALRDLTRVTGKYQKDPGFPLIGPAVWRDGPAKPGDPKASNNGTSVVDVFNKMMGG